MSRTWYLIVIGAIDLLYAWFAWKHAHTTFAKGTALFIGAALVVVPMYVPAINEQMVDQAKVAQFLYDNAPGRNGDAIVDRKLRAIEQQIVGLEEGRIDLSLSELDEAAEELLRQSATDQTATTYLATHAVDSDQSAEAWIQSESPFPWLKSYVDAQRAFLSAGGRIQRMILFDPGWLRHNRTMACEMITKHSQMLGGKRGVALRVDTLRTDDPDYGEDYSILNGKLLLVWQRTRADAGLFSGGYYRFRGDISDHVRRWNRRFANAVAPSTLLGSCQQ